MHELVAKIKAQEGQNPGTPKAEELHPGCSPTQLENTTLHQVEGSQAESTGPETGEVSQKGGHQWQINTRGCARRTNQLQTASTNHGDVTCNDLDNDMKPRDNDDH